MRAAQARLQREGRRLGYGARRDGTSDWDGRTPAFSQYVKADPALGRTRWGVFDSVDAFHDAVPSASNRRTLALRLVFPLAARRANAAAEALRASAPA